MKESEQEVALALSLCLKSILVMNLIDKKKSTIFYRLVGPKTGADSVFSLGDVETKHQP